MSNTTSLAFLELYESDEEALADEKMERKRREEDTVAWESLRHKHQARGFGACEERGGVPMGRFAQGHRGFFVQ
jgi:hypothetical protein